MRLWPIGAFALAVGVAGWFWPQVAMIGAGYAIAIALTWRGRQARGRGDRGARRRPLLRRALSAFEPLKLIRTPGLYRDRATGPEAAPATTAEAG